MESKKTFGEYIRERRRAMGLTQREFAEKLYVTESAVSKWERGMSYPDVTLLRDICAVLGVTEHELLTASEDTERRSADRLPHPGAGPGDHESQNGGCQVAFGRGLLPGVAGAPASDLLPLHRGDMVTRGGYGGALRRGAGPPAPAPALPAGA